MLKFQVAFCISLAIALKIIVVACFVADLSGHTFTICISSYIDSLIAAGVGLAIALEVIIVRLVIRMDKLQKTAGIGLTINLEIIIIFIGIVYFLNSTLSVRGITGIDTFVSLCISLSVFLEIIIISLPIRMDKFKQAFSECLAIVLKIVIICLSIIYFLNTDYGIS